MSLSLVPAAWERQPPFTSQNVMPARLGMNVEQITLAEAHRLNPFLQTEGVAAVLRVGDDMYFDPTQVAMGFARGAEARGLGLCRGLP
jgi:glycine/D-amino acid oxidase-like deaminating enzyme